MSDAISLPARLDTSAARPLAEMLWKRVSKDQAVVLDGQHVQQFGLACLQVLVSARKTAVNRGLEFRIVDPSIVLVDGFELAGGLDELAA